jgi:outer membrane protein OmpA-like peptidoglycan-associated protein
VADLGAELPDAKKVREGLFPEDECEAARREGNRCMGIEGPRVTFSLSATAFAFGSSVLPDSLKRQLDVFAEVLKTKRAGTGQTVRIIGHADVSGSAAGNAALSKRRAEEVKRYLVSKGVDGEMLEARGVGSQALLKPEAPTDAENRRVTLGR